MRSRTTTATLTLACWLLGAAQLCQSASAPSAATPASKQLSAAINAILAAPPLAGGTDGVMVADVRTGKILYARNPDTLLIPASNRKLFTAAAALALLGPNFTETTTILADAKPNASGTISGNLYLRGGGDPLLTDEDIDKMAAGLAAQGVKKVTGYVAADESLFLPGEQGDVWGDGWQADSLLDYYAPEISALEVDEGFCTIAVHGGSKLGAPTTITVSPQTSYYTVENNCITGTATSPYGVTYFRQLNSASIQLVGSVAINASPDPTDDDTDGRVTLPKPALLAATLLLEALQRRGIAVGIRSAALGVTPPGAIPLASHTSVPLSDLLGLMLKPSDNLVAECLTRLEAVRQGKLGSYDNGAAAENKYFATLGLGPTTHRFVDASGVSRINLVTSRAEMTLLLDEARRPDFATFYNAMSVAGIDGTAKNRMRGTLAAGGNAHVKTGTVRTCRSFSGYVHDRSGRLLAFVILMNNHLIPARALGAYQDKIVEYLAAIQS